MEQTWNSGLARFAASDPPSGVDARRQLVELAVIRSAVHVEGHRGVPVPKMRLHVLHVGPASRRRVAEVWRPICVPIPSKPAALVAGSHGAMAQLERSEHELNATTSRPSSGGTDTPKPRADFRPSTSACASSTNPAPPPSPDNYRPEPEAPIKASTHPGDPTEVSASVGRDRGDHDA